MDVPVVGDAISKLIDAFKQASSQYFESQPTQLQETISRMKLIFADMEKLNQALGGRTEETERFTNELKQEEKVVRKGENISGWNLFKRCRFIWKLENQKKSLLRFIQNDVRMQGVRDAKELSTAFKDIHQMIEKSWGGSCSSAGVPSLQGPVMGFKSRVKDLKLMLLKDTPVNDCQVVVVSAPGGYGKTTLVTMLCNDDEIQKRFGSNIYFASISNNPKKQVVIKNLLPTSSAGEQAQFYSDNDAKTKWKAFLNDTNKSHVLIVLDDVRSVSNITDFYCASPGYKILVTSKTTFKQFSQCTYELSRLEDEDAMNLLCYSAFSKSSTLPTCDIPDDLLKQLIKCCKNIPLALTVVGGLLKDASDWQLRLKKLSEGPQSILNLVEDEPTKRRFAACFNLNI